MKQATVAEHQLAIAALARRSARKAVTEQLRSEGVRVSLVKPSELSIRASAYLANHPELYREALYRVQRMAQEDELRKARRRKVIVIPDGPVK